MANPVLEFNAVSVTFPMRRNVATLFSAGPRELHAVDQVDLCVEKGEVLGIVGESGSGKTTISKAALGLVPVSEGRIFLNGTPLGNATPVHGAMQMVFQDPLSSFNPRHRVFDALRIPLVLNGICRRADLDETVDGLLRQVGLPRTFRARFPHELSGGQLQRLAIARAISTKPKVLFADEAVSKLDVSVRAQILNLIKRLRSELDLTVVFVTHDLHVARFLCDRIAVMYFGKLLELGPTDRIFSKPEHPYTRELIGTVANKDNDGPAVALEGFNPARDRGAGCRFVKRCRHGWDKCKTDVPTMTTVSERHEAACFLTSPDDPTLTP